MAKKTTPKKILSIKPKKPGKNIHKNHYPIKTKGGAPCHRAWPETMSKLHFEETRLQRFFKQKGFYIALGICLIAVSIATFGTLDRLGTLQAENNSSMSMPPSQISDAEKANTPVTGVPAMPTQPATTTTAAATTERVQEEAVAPPFTEPAKRAAAAPFFVMPIGGDVVKPFSEGELVYSETFSDWRVHNGIDIRAEKGSPIRSCASGTVKEIYEDVMLGTIVVVDHGNGVEGYYCGLNKIPAVKKGDVLEPGMTIGSIADIPGEANDPPHFHLEMKKDGKYADPLVLMNKIAQ